MSVEKMSPLDVYNKFNIKLVRRLPMDDAYFLANLTSEKLFCGNLRQEVDSKSTSGDKASHFLDKAIRPSLDDPDDIDLNSFFKLLRVMERHNDNLKKLATKIRIKLSNVSTDDNPLPSPDEPNGDFDFPDISKLNVGDNHHHVSKLSMGVNYHRLLWQELNKNYGNASTIFVMAVGQQLSSFDFDIAAGHAELAAQKTFELVNHTVSCATNYSPKGTLVSVMWERLLQGTGPKAGPEHQAAFEKAKRTLFVNYTTHKPTALYQGYLDKEIALKQKELQLEDECQEKYGDQWKVNFDKRLKLSKEYIEFQRAADVVKPHLDAIEVWKHGPLVHNLNQMRQVLRENAKSVNDYSGSCLKYYRVSLQPANWYQWLIPFQREEGTWTQINVDSKNDDGDQATLYKKLGGSVTTYHSLDKHSDVKISFKVRAVQINRPWLDLGVLNNRNYTIYGEDSGSWSTGELDANNNGSFPLLTTQMIVAKDITVTASTEIEHTTIGDACSLFGVGSDSYKTINNNSIELKGAKVIGYACTLLPKFPH